MMVPPWRAGLSVVDAVHLESGAGALGVLDLLCRELGSRRRG